MPGLPNVIVRCLFFYFSRSAQAAACADLPDDGVSRSFAYSELGAKKNYMTLTVADLEEYAEVLVEEEVGVENDRVLAILAGIQRRRFAISDQGLGARRYHRFRR